MSRSKERILVLGVIVGVSGEPLRAEGDGGVESLEETALDHGDCGGEDIV